MRSARGLASVASGMRPAGCSVIALLRSCGRVDVGRQSRLRHVHERREGGRVVHRKLGEHATVNLDTRELEALDESVVGHSVLAGRSVDALDPQLAEVTLALLAVAVGVNHGVSDLLLGLPVQARTLTAVTRSPLEGTAALLLGVYRPLYACHVFISVPGPLLAQQLFDL